LAQAFRRLQTFVALQSSPWKVGCRQFHKALGCSAGRTQNLSRLLAWDGDGQRRDDQRRSFGLHQKL